MCVCVAVDYSAVMATGVRMVIKPLKVTQEIALALGHSLSGGNERSLMYTLTLTHQFTLTLTHQFTLALKLTRTLMVP